MYLRDCDGSCLVKQRKSEILTFEDGTQLSFYWCRHEQVYVLTNYLRNERKKRRKKEALYDEIR